MKNTSFDDIVAKDLSDIYKKLGKMNRKFNSSTVLLTGGAGFLGYYLSYYFMFLRVEHKFQCLYLTDNFIRGKPNWVSELELSLLVFSSRSMMLCNLCLTKLLIVSRII